MNVCSSSLLPAPVVPATSACGPSARRSSANGPSAEAPTTASSLSALRARQRSAIRAGVGSTRSSRSTSATDRGTLAAAPPAVVSSTGASERARASATSGARPSADACATVRPVAVHVTFATARSEEASTMTPQPPGRWRCSRASQTAAISMSAQFSSTSSTTTASGATSSSTSMTTVVRRRARLRLWLSCRRSAASAATRRRRSRAACSPIAMCSPSSGDAGWPTCGSHDSQPQAAARSCDSAAQTMTSRGLWSVANWDMIQRATGSTAEATPTRPTAPTSVIRTWTGTTGTVLWASIAASTPARSVTSPPGAKETATIEGWSATPMRMSRKSRSVGRRSQRSGRWWIARAARSPACGVAARRSACSCARVSASWPSSCWTEALKRLRCSVCSRLPARFSLIEEPIIMSGLNAAIMSMSGDFVRR